MKLLLNRSLFFFLFLLLFSLLNNNVLISQNLTVSGITDPAVANGTYIKQVSQIFEYDYWIHSSGNYFIYNDNYAGRYWNIDDNTDDEDDVLFYHESDVTSPAGLTPWTALGTATTASPTGSPVVTEQSSASLPTVTTQAVSSISMTMATGNGNITDLGAPNPTQHGVCWNTGGTPTIADSKTEEGAAAATGAFTSNITSLSTNTTYYVRAYATNTEGTGYGNQVSFTTDPEPATVTTQAVTSITQTTATGNGNITDLGAPNPTQHGVCWNTGGTPTTSDNKTEEGAVAATGAFTSNITSLSPNTTYYVRAYATNIAGTTYGSQESFTTDPEPATVTTQAVSSISQTTATGNGNITDLGSPNPTQHGVCWNMAGTPTTTDSKTEEGAVSATGAFTCSITFLSPNTLYYVRAYVTNTAGTTYGSEVPFTTDPEPSTVTTQAVTSVTETTATGNGNITDLGAPNPTQHGVCWNTGGTPTTSDNKTEEGAVAETGAFTSSITSLSLNTTFYVRAYAINTAGTTYGSQVSFTSGTSDILSFKKDQISIFPNPTTGITYIQSKNISDVNFLVSVIDLTGKILYSKSFKQTQIELDLSNFESGLYFIEIRSDLKISKYKIFKN